MSSDGRWYPQALPAPLLRMLRKLGLSVVFARRPSERWSRHAPGRVLRVRRELVVHPQDVVQHLGRGSEGVGERGEERGGDVFLFSP